VIGPDMVARAPDGSHLVGSAVTMPQAFENLVRWVGLSEADAIKLTSANPRAAVGL
jgi:N-acetylglucosamine-6-phosphate deacetylase